MFTNTNQSEAREDSSTTERDAETEIQSGGLIDMIPECCKGGWEDCSHYVRTPRKQRENVI